nr:hypothetical protein [Tanacetum cinerariifolium]
MSSLFADTHNVVTILEKSDAAEGFKQIIDFLSGSYIHYALTVSPHIYISCIEQFWNSVSVKRSGDVTRVGKGFSGVETPLFEGMIADRQLVEEELGAEQVLETCSALARRVEGLENDKAAQQLEIVKLKARVKKLEKINMVKSSKLRRLKKVKTSQRVKSSDDMENVFNQGSIIANMDQDEGIELVVAASTPIPAAKPKILNIAAAPTVSTRRRKGVVIRDPEEELPSDTPVKTPKVKDKGKGILIEAPKPIKKKDQIEMDAEYARKPQEEINKEHEETYKNIDLNAALDHNTEGYKMDFFKGMKYDEILPIFQAKFDANMRFLFKSREEMEEEDQEIIKSINETPAQKVVKGRKLSEEAQKAEDLKKRLEVVEDEDDDVFVKATPLAQKVHVVDYQIVLIENKPRYKIIRTDDTHQLYISFTTLLKNFDKEDLETL